MSTSSNLNVLTNITTKRSNALGINLSAKQASVNVPTGTKSEILIIPSSSTPAFGGYFVCDVREKNCIISDLILNFNVTALTCTNAAGTNYPHFVPASFWFTRLEVVINSQVVDTIYGNEQFLLKQLAFEDEDRVMINAMEGSYASLAQRGTLASTASQNYYVKLKTLFDVIHYPILTDQHSVQIRVYMDSLQNLCALGTGLVNSGSASINSANIIAKITRLPPDVASSRLALMSRNPEANLFHNLKYGTFTVQSGVTTTNIVLTPIVGNVAFMAFVVRPTNALVFNSCYQYTAISNYAIVGSDGANCVGGSAIPSQLCLQYLMQNWSRSSYTTETSIGANLAGAVNNNSANVYGWSFSSNPQEAIGSGLLLGNRRFMGSEQLQLTFTASLGSNVQVDVYAFTESVLTQGASSITVQLL